MKPNNWSGINVLVTGHTGFKGSWLSLWLQKMGAHVHGFSLEPPTQPNLFTVASVADVLSSHTVGDIRNLSEVEAAFRSARPDVVLHLAAQSLVRESYSRPLETYTTNIMGTINIFEAARKAESVRAILNVTTDKCYENREWVWGYREHEAMGGRDPYSSSKGCSELVTAAYRDSFFRDQGIAIASARAGNVIGGGDWATDRLIPDFLRALDSGIPLDVRYPNATRPWQHVLEPLSGYLLLAEQLMSQNPSADQAWNFGPADNDARPVSWILDYLISRAPVASWRHIGGQHLHEAGYLKLDSSRAHRELGWHPRWNLITALDSTLDWHFAWQDGQEMNNFCMEQIKTYSAD